MEDKYNFIFISGGTAHTIGLTGNSISFQFIEWYLESGQLFSCGLNKNGQLGISDNTNRNTPHKISTFDNQQIISISCGNYHSVAINGNFWNNN